VTVGHGKGKTWSFIKINTMANGKIWWTCRKRPDDIRNSRIIVATYS